MTSSSAPRPPSQTAAEAKWTHCTVPCTHFDEDAAAWLEVTSPTMAASAPPATTTNAARRTGPSDIRATTTAIWIAATGIKRQRNE